MKLLKNKYLVLFIIVFSICFFVKNNSFASAFNLAANSNSKDLTGSFFSTPTITPSAPVVPAPTAAAVQAVASATPTEGQDSGIKGFNEWKMGRVQNAQNRLLQVKNSKSLAQSQQAKDPNLVNSEKRNLSEEGFIKELAEENWNLEVAKDLSITDYLILYLANQATPNKYNELAKKLSNAEVALLIEAYSKALQSNVRPAGALPSDSGGSQFKDSKDKDVKDSLSGSAGGNSSSGSKEKNEFEKNPNTQAPPPALSKKNSGLKK